MQAFKTIESAQFAKQRIFLRADLNVPLENGAISTDFRLKSIVPTIDAILQKSGKIVLATHIGRPQMASQSLSTQILVPWFEKRGYKITFVPDLDTAYEHSFVDFESILLLENLRFFPGEKENNPAFAKQLARLGDYYVNDAFGLIHRTDCSVYGVPQLFEPSKRMIGLLMVKELRNADHLKHSAQKPFILILGGNKVAEKLKLIEALEKKIDSILLCPAIVFSFLKATGIQVGASLVDQSSISVCRELAGRMNPTQLILPVDYKVTNTAMDKPLRNVTTLTDDEYGISIGSKTERLFNGIIQKSGTVFYNGLMGDLGHPETLLAVKSLFDAMGQSAAYSVIGGGDSTAAAQILDVDNAIDFMSTGGGSLIAYLANPQLPALQILLNK